MRHSANRVFKKSPSMNARECGVTTVLVDGVSLISVLAWPIVLVRPKVIIMWHNKGHIKSQDNHTRKTEINCLLQFSWNALILTHHSVGIELLQFSVLIN